MLNIFPCQQSGGWRYTINTGIQDFCKKSGVPFNLIKDNSDLSSFNAPSDTWLVCDTQEYGFLKKAKPYIQGKVYGIKLGGRLTYMDYKNVYDYDVAQEIEEINFFDGLFFLSDTHIQPYQEILKATETHTCLTGMPLKFDEYKDYATPKIKDSIVVPNRLTNDKQPWLLFMFLDKYCADKTVLFTNLQVDDEWVTTKLNQLLNKHKKWYVAEDYHQALSDCEYIVNFSLHETFGVTVAEALHYGCLPVIPNIVSYPTLIDKTYLYDAYSLESAAEKLKNKEVKHFIYDYDHLKVFTKIFKFMGVIN